VDCDVDCYRPAFSYKPASDVAVTHYAKSQSMYVSLVLLQLLKSAPKLRFLAISNPIETAVLDSLLTVSVLLVFEMAQL